MDDQLGEHRVIKGRNFNILFQPGLYPRLLRKEEVVDFSAARPKLVHAVLRIDAHLNRVAVRRKGHPLDSLKLSRSLLHHPLHKVDTHNFFRNPMLDLKPRIYLKEIKALRAPVVQKFHGAGISVRGSFCKAPCRLMHFPAYLLREVRSRRFLNHLLIPPLNGAVSFAEHRDFPFGGTEYLHLYVSRVPDIFFKEHTRIVKIALGKVPHLVIGIRKLRFVIANTDADSAAARRTFEHDRITDASGFLHRLSSTAEQPGTGKKRDTRRNGDLPCRMF